MSELTPCNYCILRGIRRRAEESGKVVTLRPGGIGTDVYVHPEGEPVEDRHWTSSMMVIGSRCEC